MTNIILDTIAKKNVDYTPIWLMRQAGRYLPEYRKIRENAGSFLNLCKNPDLATTVTLQPLKRFNLDAAILFSDILVIPEAMGMELNFIENEGPKFSKKIKTIEDVDNLDIKEIIPRLGYVFSTIKNCKEELNKGVPLIGFSGSPFTLACYMIEGGSSSNYLAVKELLYNNPKMAHLLLDKLTKAVIQYLTSQIEAGVDLVMLFDSWGGILTDSLYQEFSVHYLKQVIAALPSLSKTKSHLPKIVFTKGSGSWLNTLSTVGANVIGLDWTINIGQARDIIPNEIAIQGNLDPVLLAVGGRVALKNEVKRILEAYSSANSGSNSGHIFNLGHGILPITNPDNVAYLVDLVHGFGSGP